MRIAICDDVPLYMDIIIELLESYQEERPGVKLSLHGFNSASALLKRRNEGQQFDAYLLDVIMPGTDGIVLAQKIRLLDEDVPIIFITQSDEHALDAFSVSAAQYIVKPIKKEALFAVLDKIISMHKRETDNFTSVSALGRVVKLLHSSIVMVENSGRALRFHLDTGEIIDSKAIRTTFANALTNILNDSRFLWVHQSYVINMNHVKELQSRAFIMKNGMEVSIPRPKYAANKRAYLKYIVRE
jgi:DNA-binding LytR/AlgR family response regulator